MSQLWNGFRMEELEFEGMSSLVVCPKKGTEIGRLAIKTEYWGAFPVGEVALLDNGFHLCYI